MSYDRLKWSEPDIQKDVSLNQRYKTINELTQLPLPPEIIRKMIMLFKYQCLEKHYKKNYRKVLYQLKQRFRHERLSKQRFRHERLSKQSGEPSPSPPVFCCEKQLASDVVDLDYMLCP